MTRRLSSRRAASRSNSTFARRRSASWIAPSLRSKTGSGKEPADPKGGVVGLVVTSDPGASGQIRNGCCSLQAKLALALRKDSAPGADDGVVVETVEEGLHRGKVMPVVAKAPSDRFTFSQTTGPVRGQLASRSRELCLGLVDTDPHLADRDLAARDGGWQPGSGFKAPSQQRNQVFESFGGPAEQLDPLLGAEDLDIVDLGLRDDLAHGGRDLGVGDFLLANGDRNAGAALFAALELLLQGDGQNGFVEALIVAGPTKILDLDAELRIGPLASLDNAALRGLDLKLSGWDARVEGQRLLQRRRKIDSAGGTGTEHAVNKGRRQDGAAEVPKEMSRHVRPIARIGVQAMARTRSSARRPSYAARAIGGR